MMEAKFEKQTYGAVVATILETDNSIVEVQARNDGVYGLIVHSKSEHRDNWDDLTAYLKPEHFDALGSIAHRMRGERLCCRGLAPEDECPCLQGERGRARLALNVIWEKVNALGGYVADTDREARARGDLIDQVLGIIEEVGGVDSLQHRAALTKDR